MSGIVADTLASPVDTGPSEHQSSRRLRICFVSADYPTLTRGGIGGIGGHSYTLAHAVAELGHEVSVVAEASGAPGLQADGRVRLHAISRGSSRQWKLGNFVPVPWLRWSFAVDRKLRHLHAKHPFDLIVFPDAYAEGFRFSLAPCAPFVVRFGGPASVVQRWDGRVLNRARTLSEAWLERTPALRAPILLCASRAFADQISGEWGLDASRFRIVRNPLNLDRFHPAEPGARAPGERVLFVGHIQPLKGMHELIAAVPMVSSRHPEARFQLVGNDTRTGPDRTSLRNALEQTLRSQGALDRVQFRDPLPQSDLPPLYQDCSVFVLPSHHDVYPNAVLEAMGCGRPIVVTSTAGAAELVSESGCGIVVPPNDTHALAAALSEILAMPAPVRDEMGARGRRLVEQVCATPVIAAQAIAAYREAIGRYRSPSTRSHGVRK
jgi:glycogen synthase